MEAARWFVRDAERQQGLGAKLGRQRLNYYLASVGVLAHTAGEPEAALPYYAESEAIDRQRDDRRFLSADLQNLAEVETSLGRIGDAVGHAREALEVAIVAQDDDKADNSLACLAFAVSLRGDMDTPDKSFAEANSIEKRLYGWDLQSIWCINWAEHLLRTGQTSQACKLTTANRKICERNSWEADVA